MKKFRERKLWKDLRQYKWVLLAAAAVITGMHVFFHRSCPSELIFGLPCPGCGITRALVLLCTGHPVLAFRMNPSVYVWIGLIGYLFIFRYVLEKKVPYLSAVLTVSVALILLVYGIGMWKYFPVREPYTVTENNLLGILFPPYKKLLIRLK